MFQFRENCNMEGLGGGGGGGTTPGSFFTTGIVLSSFLKQFLAQNDSRTVCSLTHCERQLSFQQAMCYLSSGE